MDVCDGNTRYPYLFCALLLCLNVTFGKLSFLLVGSDKRVISTLGKLEHIKSCMKLEKVAT